MSDANVFTKIEIGTMVDMELSTDIDTYGFVELE